MIILFNRNTDEKIAYLDDVIIEDSIQITRKINGDFTLSFELLEDDLKSINLESEGYILCDGYYFDIKYIEKEHSDTLTYGIECEHVSYRLIEDEVEYYTFDGTPLEILTDILSETEFSPGEIDSTDIITFAVYEETNKLGLVQKLANLLELEVDYNNFSISLKNTIGENSGFAARFGKNLKGIRKIIDRRSNLTYYDIDLVELKDHPEHSEFKDLERVGVGDTIRIIDKAMNIDVLNKVVKTSYNPIKSINSKLEIANSIELLTDKVTKIQRDTIAKGKTYHGIKISPDTGFESIRSDKMARGIFNSDTFALQKGDGTGNNWINKLYFDPIEGKYIFDGVLSAGMIEALEAEFDITVSNTVVTEALYAENGAIAKLTVDMVETSNKVDRYLNEDTSDMYYQKMFEQNLQYIEASVIFDGSTPLVEQLRNREGNNLFWKDETYTIITIEETNYPAMIYKYDEGVKMQIAFELDSATGYNLPIIDLGEGDGILPNSSKGKIYKDVNGVKLEYYKSNTAEKVGFYLTDNGVYCSDVLHNLIPVRDTAPENPEEGDFWIDTTEGQIISDEQGRELTGGGDTELHTHDDRYFTEDEIMYLFEDFYYGMEDFTSGVYDGLEDKSDIGHQHTEVDVVNLDKYSQSEVDEKIDDAVTSSTLLAQPYLEGYVHTQSTASSAWIINHGLDKYPPVTIVDSANNEIETDIEYIDSNTVKSSSNGAFAGKAFIN